MYNAILERNSSLLECLLNENINLDVQTKNGATPLIFAALNNQIQFAATLISKGANCNLAKNNGITALMIAANLGYKNLADMLVECCEVNQQDQFSNTALTYAIKAGNYNIVSVLVAELDEKDIKKTVEPYIDRNSKAIEFLYEEIFKQGYYLNDCIEYLGTHFPECVLDMGAKPGECPSSPIYNFI